MLILRAKNSERETEKKPQRNMICLLSLLLLVIRFSLVEERKRRQSERNRYGILSVCIIVLRRLFGASLRATLWIIGIPFSCHKHLKQMI